MIDNAVDAATGSIRTAAAELGLLVVERVGNDAPAGPMALRLTCTIGRSGNPAKERRVIAEVRERLLDLRGVEFAPVPP